MTRKFAPKEAAEALIRVASGPGRALKVATAAVGVGVAAAAVARNRSKKAVVKYLQVQLGSGMTAYLSGADDAQIVDLWVQGEARPDKLRWRRLRSAYDATRVLVEAYDDQTARSWFVGMNPTLADESPARLLRNSRTPRVWGEVVLAAREFAET